MAAKILQFRAFALFHFLRFNAQFVAYILRLKRANWHRDMAAMPATTGASSKLSRMVKNFIRCVQHFHQFNHWPRVHIGDALRQGHHMRFQLGRNRVEKLVQIRLGVGASLFGRAISHGFYF